MIIAGDVGGTSTRLALVDPESDAAGLRVVEIFPSKKYSGLEDVVRAFLQKEHVPVHFACFGVPGPVLSGRCKTPNLPWIVDADRLEKALGIPTVELINDLEAHAHGITVLDAKDFVTLHEGVAETMGNAALVSPGTGLGQAGLHRVHDHHEPFPSEGGHSTFAPRNELEIDLLRHLQKQYEHVSFERIVSGPGLYNIYTFLRDTGRENETSMIAERMMDSDPAPVISNAALEKTCSLCEKSLDLFVSIFGSESGNVALKFKATGGIYLGGGIAPRILDKLVDGTFMESFTAKGRMKPLLERIPVRVIMNDKTALLGAAQKALMK